MKKLDLLLWVLMLSGMAVISIVHERWNAPAPALAAGAAPPAPQAPMPGGVREASPRTSSRASGAQALRMARAAETVR